MRRKKIYIPPQLRHRGEDLSLAWYVEFSYRNPKNGKMVRFRRQTYLEQSLSELKTKEERYQLAEKIIEEINNKLNNGWDPFTDTQKAVYEDQLQYHNMARVYRQKTEYNTFKYWYSAYLEEVFQVSYEGETARSYISKFRQFSFWLEAKGYHSYDIFRINNTLIKEFFVHLKVDKQFSLRTYNGYAFLLERFFDFVIKKGGIAENPVYDLPPNRNIKDMGAERIRKSDISHLMNEIDLMDKQLGMAVRFEYYCGMRPGFEIRFLKIADIDFRQGFSKVRISVENAKTSRRREITLPDVFLDYLLKEWDLVSYPKEYFVFSQKGRPGMKHLGRNSLRNRFNKIRDKLNLPKEYKLYSFKLTGAITLAEQGEPTINIRDHLGHTSIETTEFYLRRHGFIESKTIRTTFPKI